MKHLAVAKELGICIASPEAASHPELPNRHLFSTHAPLWAYCDPRSSRPFASWARSPAVFEFLPAQTTVDEAVRHTRLLGFLGASRSAEFEQALAAPNVVRLVFEPDPEKLEAFLADMGVRSFLDMKTYFFCGDPRALQPSLASSLPQTVADLGFPVFFVQEGLQGSEIARETIAQVELFYFRNVIYHIAGPDHFRGFPLRAMLRRATYDRVRHAYENLTVCTAAGVLGDLKDAFAGESAILAGAGPSLPERMDWLARQRDRAVLIAVNNALPPLLEHGISPDFVIINDTTIVAGASLDNLPRLPETNLVGHCLSRLPFRTFGRTFVFGNEEGQPFPERDTLLLHGSVLTTAFSLAEYMGCARACLVGAQLASRNPFRLSYSKGSVHGEHECDYDPAALPNRFPQLYPAMAADGSRMFTSLNFFDAAQWLVDRIRESSMQVTNTAPDSIIHGPGIVIDPAPDLPAAPGLEKRKAALAMHPPEAVRERAGEFARRELARWRGVAQEAENLAQALATDGEDAFEPVARFIARCDRDNTSFMLTQFPGFDNGPFHEKYFQTEDRARRRQGAAYFLRHLAAMGRELSVLLDEQARRLA